MRTERFQQNIKTRVPAELKRELESIAQGRHLDLSDIVREALRIYAVKNNPAQLELLANGTKGGSTFQ